MIDALPPGLDAARRRLLRLRRTSPVSEEPTAPLLALRAAELLRAVETGAARARLRRALAGAGPGGPATDPSLDGLAAV